MIREGFGRTRRAAPDRSRRRSATGRPPYAGAALPNRRWKLPGPWARRSLFVAAQTNAPIKSNLEASPGIEPGCKDLQTGFGPKSNPLITDENLVDGSKTAWNSTVS